jgi:hypothetical protein
MRFSVHTTRSRGRRDSTANRQRGFQMGVCGEASVVAAIQQDAPTAALSQGGVLQRMACHLRQAQV